MITTALSNLGFDTFDALAGLTPMRFATSNLSDQKFGGGFPFYDTVEVGENLYRIEIAVAGYSEKDIDISLNNNVLTVKGSRNTVEGNDVKYLHKGISYRQFERSFTIGDYINVTGARLENGILAIDLEKIVPEEKKPRQIAISNGTRTIESK